MIESGNLFEGKASRCLFLAPCSVLSTLSCSAISASSPGIAGRRTASLRSPMTRRSMTPFSKGGLT